MNVHSITKISYLLHNKHFVFIRHGMTRRALKQSNETYGMRFFGHKTCIRVRSQVHTLGHHATPRLTFLLIAFQLKPMYKIDEFLVRMFTYLMLSEFSGILPLILFILRRLTLS